MVRLEALEKHTERTVTALESIQRSLSALAVYNERASAMGASLDRAFIHLQELQGDMTTIQIAMPELKRVTGWVQRAAIGIVALVGIAIWEVFIKQVY